MSKTQKDYKDEFIKSLQCNDPKTLTKIWYNRSNDNFYFVLEQLKTLTDSYFPLETNPLTYVMMAYCFDGEKYKTIEKVRNIITPLVLENEENADNIVNTFVTLEEFIEDDNTTVLINANEEIPLSINYNLVLHGFEKDYGIIGKNFKTVKTEDGIKYVFDAYADDEDVKWIKETLFAKDKDNSFITRNLTVSLQDKYNDNLYDLIYLTDSTPLRYIDNDDTEILEIEFVCDQYYFCSECDNPMIEDIKNKITQKLENVVEKIEDELNWPPKTSKNVDIDISEIKNLSFRLSGFDKDDCLHFYGLKMMNSFFGNLILTVSDIACDSDDSFTKIFEKCKNANQETSLLHKSDFVKDVKIELYDSAKNKLYDIATLNSAYIVYIDEDQFEVAFDAIFIANQDNNKVANYVRNQMNTLMSDIYRNVNE